MPDAVTNAEADRSIIAADDVSQQRHPAEATLDQQPPRDHGEREPLTGRQLLSGIVSRIVPQAGALLTAGFSADFATIDTAMNQLLDDLDVLRSDTTSVIDSLPISTWAISATAAAIAVEVVRRRRRDAMSGSSQHTLDAQVALWMYPECSGLPGRTAR